METSRITYEQPLNEYIRVCLRLEHLFNKWRHNQEDTSLWGSRAMITTLLEILNVVDRPDLKPKLAKALGAHAEKLTKLVNLPNVDGTKLQEVLDKLDNFSDNLHSIQGKLGAHLRTNEFIKTISQHTNAPGGACNFSVPAYQLWLEQPLEKREQTITSLFKTFEPLQETVDLLLSLTRQSIQTTQETANKGFYQTTLDPNTDYQMIRVTVDLSAHVYPEISVGRHRLSIYFYLLNLHDRPSRVVHDIHFSLAR